MPRCCAFSPAPRSRCSTAEVANGPRTSCRWAGAIEFKTADALAVEMEGAAVAQVCHDFGRAFAVMRTISDRADDAAHVDFPRFVADVASGLTRRIVAHALA